MPNPGPTETKTTNNPTLDPKTIAAQAELAGGNVSTSTKSNVITGVVLGYDSQGNPIYNLDPKTGKPAPIYASGYEQTYIKNLPPAARKTLQQKMFKLGLYPKGFTPSEILTPQDFDAVLKLVAVGEQKGIGDINAVINLANTDKKVASFLKTGGFAATGTVSTTTADAAKASLNDYFLNLFNEKPTKDDIKLYQTTLNAREKKAKGALTQQEREDIILAVANKKIAAVAGKALGGDVAAQEALDTGQLGKRVREIRSYYDDNGIPVSDRQVYNLAGKSLRGQDAYDNILEDITQSAALQWGQIGQGLKPGQSVRTKLQPYIAVRAAVTGIPEDQIKVSDMQDVVNPDGTIKKPNEYKMTQYKSKDYLESDSFKNTVLNDTQAVLRNFGIG
jgi:hypothetical protein